MGRTVPSTVAGGKSGTVDGGQYRQRGIFPASVIVDQKILRGFSDKVLGCLMKQNTTSQMILILKS